jgi:hypothetical protein
MGQEDGAWWERAEMCKECSLHTSNSVVDAELGDDTLPGSYEERVGYGVGQHAEHGADPSSTPVMLGRRDGRRTQKHKHCDQPKDPP